MFLIERNIDWSLFMDKSLGYGKAAVLPCICLE